MSTAGARTCSQCQAPLPVNAPGNRCPKCLLELALDEASTAEIEETSPLSRSELLSERPGAVIGRYKLLQQIGEGGFGIVFLAEQTEPVRRQVALKVIKAGMDTREIIARFEAERQALALMEHPNIAQVLDGGATAGGRPYFVMELVRGLPITAYCDQASLSMPERLELFIQVCRAVQHAHQKGIIHRDLKPGNVLVAVHDGKPVPKVIDFGVAKALGHKLTAKTLLLTRLEQMIGTPAYMSPEQAEMGGVDIDTRSDIYSLGVLLYELLTGVTPLDAEALRQGAFDEIRRMIRETDPPTPSTRLLLLGERLVDVAKHRHTEPGALTRSIRGDLDWIAMKALEKNRQRRYETVNGLALDIERHLRNEPVVARPPSALYRLQKAARRHRFAVVVGAVLTLSLVLGLVASTLLAVRATRAERLARLQSAENQAVMEILDHTLSSSDPTGENIRQRLLDSVSDWLNRQHRGEEQQVEIFIRRMQGNMLNLRKGTAVEVAGPVAAQATPGAFEAQPQAMTNLGANLGTASNIASVVSAATNPISSTSVLEQATAARSEAAASEQQKAKAQARVSPRTSATNWPFKGTVFVASAEVIGKEGIRGIVVNGPEFIKEKSFEQELGRFLGEPITELVFLRLQKTIVDWCRSEGHPSVDVVIPPQNIENGLLRVIVLSSINAAHFGPEGQSLSVSTNISVRVWDAQSGLPITNHLNLVPRP